MLENKQKMTEAALVVAIKAASTAGEAIFARELLMMHSKNKHRPQEQLYVYVSFGGRSFLSLQSFDSHTGCVSAIFSIFLFSERCCFFFCF